MKIKSQKGFTLTELISVVGFLTVIVGGIYITFHFVAKYW